MYVFSLQHNIRKKWNSFLEYNNIIFVNDENGKNYTIGYYFWKYIYNYTHDLTNKHFSVDYIYNGQYYSHILPLSVKTYNDLENELEQFFIARNNITETFGRRLTSIINIKINNIDHTRKILSRLPPVKIRHNHHIMENIVFTKLNNDDNLTIIKRSLYTVNEKTFKWGDCKNMHVYDVLEI